MDNHFGQRRLPLKRTKRTTASQPRAQVPELRRNAPTPSAPLNLTQPTEKSVMHSTTHHQPVDPRYSTTLPENQSYLYQQSASGYHQQGAQYTNYVEQMQKLLAAKETELVNRRDAESYMQSKLTILQQNNIKLGKDNQQLKTELESLKTNTVQTKQFTEMAARYEMISNENEKLLKENEMLSNAKAEGERHLQEVDKFKKMFNNEKVKCEKIAEARNFIKDKQMELLAQERELRGKVEGYQVEVNTLRENLSRVEDSLNAKVEEVKSALDNVKVLKCENETLVQKTNNIEAEKQQLMISLQLLLNDKEAKSQCILNLEVEKQELLINFQQLETDKEKMKKASKKRKAKLDELKNKDEEMVEDTKRFIRHVGELEKEMKELEEEKEGLISHVGELEKGENELKEQVRELEEEKCVSAKTVDELKENNELLLKNIEDLKATKAPLKKTVIQQQKEIQNLKKNVEDLQSQNHSQLETVENLKAEIDKLTEETNTLNSDKKVLFQQKQAELAEHMEASKQIKSELQTANKNIENLQTENTKLKQKVDNEGERARLANKKANDQGSKLLNLYGRIDFQNAELNKNSNEIVSLKKLLKEAEAATNATINQLKIKVESLTTDNNFLKGQLGLNEGEKEIQQPQQTSLQEKVNDLLEKNRKWAMKSEEPVLSKKKVEKKLHETALLLQKVQDELSRETFVTKCQKEAIDVRDAKIHELQEKVDEAAEKSEEISRLAAAVEDLAAEASNYEAQITKRNKIIEQLQEQKLEFNASSKSCKKKKTRKRESLYDLNYSSTDDDDDGDASKKKFCSEDDEDPCLAKYIKRIEEEAAAK